MVTAHTLGMEKGCFVLKDKKGWRSRGIHYLSRKSESDPEKRELHLDRGLSLTRFWDIDVLVLTQRGSPVAMLKSLDDDSHVQTRVAQYQASLDERAFEIAKKLVIAKLESQNIILQKYGLDPHLDDFKGEH